MEELKLFYQELQERRINLENRKETDITQGRIAENLIMLVRIQELIIKKQTSKE